MSDVAAEREEAQVSERPIGLVRGTRDWLPPSYARLAELETMLLDRFARAGYQALRTPVLESIQLHERKSGAGIVGKLFELSGSGPDGVCLRPELTAGIVRAYTAAEPAPVLPWRVSHVGLVFRHGTLGPDRLREFEQVGVELLGASGPAIDGEVIWLADWALAEAGVRDATIRVGYVGLILELLERSGLPRALAAALVERLSEAAAEGQTIRALELGLEQLEGWLRHAETGEIPPAVERVDEGGIDRLFRTLVPVVTGRRSGHEIVHRLRRKWDLGHDLIAALEDVRGRVHDLAELHGSPGIILERLERQYAEDAPASVSALCGLARALEDYGIALDRVELDLGFGRGIGFYSRMVFELVVPTPSGPIEVCGGGRYDGLARALGSPRDDRGVGFAVGLERLAGVLEVQGEPPSARPACGYLVVAEGAEASTAAAAVRWLTELRKGGARAVLETERSPAASIAQAKALGLAYVLTIPGGSTGLHLLELTTGQESHLGSDALPRLLRKEGACLP
jgi:histidyl-tRNA synthetase